MRLKMSTWSSHSHSVISSQPSVLASNTIASFQWLSPASADGTLSFQECLTLMTKLYFGIVLEDGMLYFAQSISIQVSLSNCALSQLTPQSELLQVLNLPLEGNDLDVPLIPPPSIISQAWLKSSFHQGLGLAVYHSNDEPKLISAFLFSLLELNRFTQVYHLCPSISHLQSLHCQASCWINSTCPH